jgi:hypothetical protein
MVLFFSSRPFPAVLDMVLEYTARSCIVLRQNMGRKFPNSVFFLSSPDLKCYPYAYLIPFPHPLEKGADYQVYYLGKGGWPSVSSLLEPFKGTLGYLSSGLRVEN